MTRTRFAIRSKKLNKAAYARLLARALPGVIKSDEENGRVVAELERLDSLARPLTPEEERLAELMTVLVRQFEAARYPLGSIDPVAALRELMEFRGLRQRDMLPVFGSSSVVSNVLNGKRSISKAHARKLSETYGVPVRLFI